eukprot:5287997-Prymnesium_polylepis.1
MLTGGSCTTRRRWAWCTTRRRTSSTSSAVTTTTSPPSTSTRTRCAPPRSLQRGQPGPRVAVPPARGVCARARAGLLTPRPPCCVRAGEGGHGPDWQGPQDPDLDLAARLERRAAAAVPDSRRSQACNRRPLLLLHRP